MKRLFFIFILSIAIIPGAVNSATASVPRNAWMDLPVIPVIQGKVKTAFVRDLEKSRRHSMRPRVFAKVGDSNTEMASALYGLACRRAKLTGRFRLRSVIDRYNRVQLENERAMPGCRPSTSFSRRSASAKSGSYSTWSLTRNADLPPDFPYWQPPSDCPLKETPLICEVRTLQPRYTLIMTGTNDLGMDIRFGIGPGRRTASRMSALIREVRRLGSVPVISTLPPVVAAAAPPGVVNSSNAGIDKAARQNSVPIINLWRALAGPGMINSGMEDSGFHLRSQPGGDSRILEPGPTTFADSVDFRPEALRFGANRRNLIWLQTLAALDRAAGV